MLNSCERFLVLFVLVPLVFTFSVDNDEPSRSAVQSHEVAETMGLFETQSIDADAGEEPLRGKINWAPVWDDIETSKEVGWKHQIDEENCLTTPSKGLYSFIMEANSMLPTQQISDVILSFSKDPEFIVLKNFLHSAEYKTLIDALKNSDELKLLQSYSCNILHLDISHLFTTCIYVPSEIQGQSYGGIKALFKRLVDIKAHEQLIDLYKRLRHSDEDLMQAEANLRSPEFHQLLFNLRNTPAYVELMEELRLLGVPIDDIRNYIEKIFQNL